ncbi:MAG: hypothetical protein II202_03865 [Bacteroidales bacterium]|nr:hypothetical protein [Bacteroidales bacterium]
MRRIRYENLRWRDISDGSNEQLENSKPLYYLFSLGFVEAHDEKGELSDIFADPPFFEDDRLLVITDKGLAYLYSLDRDNGRWYITTAVAVSALIVSLFSFAVHFL